MDRDILHIYEVLSSANVPLTAGEISKEIFKRYDIRLSKTIVRNYLWSYFRNLIDYNPDEFTFSLKDDRFLITDIDVSDVDHGPRAVSAQFEGARIRVSYDNRVPIETYIKAISIINYKYRSSKKKVDLIKQLNRTIEQILDEND